MNNCLPNCSGDGAGGPADNRIHPPKLARNMLQSASVKIRTSRVFDSCRNLRHAVWGLWIALRGAFGLIRSPGAELGNVDRRRFCPVTKHSVLIASFAGLLAWAALICTANASDPLPASRKPGGVGWAGKVGVPGGIPNRTTIYTN